MAVQIVHSSRQGSQDIEQVMVHGEDAQDLADQIIIWERLNNKAG